jgi:hypothetical protein
MALVEINLNPTKRDLQWFGALLAAVAGVVGATLYWRFDAPLLARVAWGLGGLVALVYYAFRPLRRAIFLTWTYAVYPLGWTVSHLALSVMYYAVLTPIGLVMRLFGRDPLTRSFDPQATTYWVERRTAEKAARYFKQF